jgi:hypothetical protein
MERKIVERRTVLKGGAAAVGMLGSGASASMVAGVDTVRYLEMPVHLIRGRLSELLQQSYSADISAIESVCC